MQDQQPGSRDIIFFPFAQRWQKRWSIGLFSASVITFALYTQVGGIVMQELRAISFWLSGILSSLALIFIAWSIPKKWIRVVIMAPGLIAIWLALGWIENKEKKVRAKIECIGTGLKPSIIATIADGQLGRIDAKFNCKISGELQAPEIAVIKFRIVTNPILPVGQEDDLYHSGHGARGPILRGPDFPRDFSSSYEGDLLTPSIWRDLRHRRQVAYAISEATFKDKYGPMKSRSCVIYMAPRGFDGLDRVFEFQEPCKSNNWTREVEQ